MTNFVAVVGADDPEMKEIVEILATNGVETIFAERGGRRVHPGNAYDADAPEVPTGAKIIAIECGWPGMADVTVIDHHRPGDPGYGMGASEYWEASSIGQVYGLMGIPSNPEAKAVAAVDHCAADAMHGRCPGVDAETARATRRRQINAAFPNLTARDREALLEPIMTALGFAGLATVEIGGSHAILDFASQSVAPFEPTGIPTLAAGYSYEYLMLQQIWMENLSRQFDGMIFLHRDVEGGPEKCVFNGKQETARAFMNEWAPSRGLVQIYGNPERGYAGGYIEPGSNKKTPKHIKKLFSNITKLISTPRG